MPKPPSKGGAESHGQPKPAPSNTRLTRSAAQAVANGKPISQQTEARNDVAAPATNRVTSTTITILQPIVEALNRILDGEDSSERIIEGVFRYIRESEKTERVTRERQEVQAEVSALRKAFKADLGKIHDDLAI